MSNIMQACLWVVEVMRVFILVKVSVTFHYNIFRVR